MDAREFHRNIQINESAARALVDAGRLDEATKLVFKIVDSYPKSPIFGLGFRIARLTRNFDLGQQLFDLILLKGGGGWALYAEFATFAADFGDLARASELLTIARQDPKTSEEKLATYVYRINKSEALLNQESPATRKMLAISIAASLKSQQSADTESLIDTFFNQSGDLAASEVFLLVRSLRGVTEVDALLKVLKRIESDHHQLSDLFAGLVLKNLIIDNDTATIRTWIDVVEDQGIAGPNFQIATIDFLSRTDTHETTMKSVESLIDTYGADMIPLSYLKAVLRGINERSGSTVSLTLDRLVTSLEEGYVKEVEWATAGEANSKIERDEVATSNFVDVAATVELIVENFRSRQFQSVSETLNEVSSERVRSDIIHGVIKTFGHSKEINYIPPLFEIVKGLGMSLGSGVYAIAMMSYAQCGDYRRVEQLLNENVREAKPIGKRHFAALIGVYSSMGKLKTAEGYLNILRTTELTPQQRYHYFPVIRAYQLAKRFDDVARLLTQMREDQLLPDNHLAQIGLNSLVEQGRFEDCVREFDNLLHDGLIPDSHTYVPYLRALRQLNHTDAMLDAFAQMEDQGIFINAIHWTQLILCVGNGADEAKFDEFVGRCLKSSSFSDVFLLHSILSVTNKNGWHAIGAIVVKSCLENDVHYDLDLLRSLTLAAMQARNSELWEATSRHLLYKARNDFDDLVDYALAEAFFRSGGIVDKEFVATVLSSHEIRGSVAHLVYDIADCEAIADRKTMVEALCTRLIGKVNATQWFRVLFLILSRADDFESYEFALDSCPVITSLNLGELMLQATRQRNSMEVERLLYKYLHRTNRADQTYLFNLALRAHVIFGETGRISSLRSQMTQLGLEIDSFTNRYLGRAYDEDGSFAEGLLSTNNPESTSENFSDLRTVLDDVVHELSQWLGSLGLLIPATQSILHGSNVDLRVVENLFQMTGIVRTIADRLNEYQAVSTNDFSPEPFNLSEVIDWVVQRKSTDAARFNIEIHSKYGPKDRLLSVSMSAFMLRLAVKALVTNSIEALAMKPLGEGTRDIWISISDNNISSKNVVDLIVRDNGPGIPSEMLERVFERGFTTKKNRGLGLGLNLVKNVIAWSGGQISVTSNDGSGAEFWIRLPLAT